MAKGLYIEVKGLKDLPKMVGDKANAIIKEVDNHMAMAANDYANRAIREAPVDEGMLRQGISAKKKGVLEYDVVSAADYSAYVEFGTKTKVEIPPDLSAYAQQFRGKKLGKGLFERIYDWVKRKGIAATMTKSGRRSTAKAAQQAEYAAARAIYYHILKYGTKAQPFFFKHRKPVYAQLQKELGPAIKKALGK